MSNNRVRILSDLVGLEAWHSAFTEKRLQVTLHADVTFKTAYMGGEKESPARFTVDVKQAELRIWIPAGEEISIIRSSVNRMDPQISGVRKTHLEKKTKSGGGFSVSAGASEKGVSAKAGLSLLASAEASVREESKSTSRFEAIISAHSADESGGHRWRMTPGDGRALVGKPWQASKTPLMKIRDDRNNRAFTPTVKIEITCKREDLVISNFALKDRSLWNEMWGKPGFKNRMQAAEAFIRNRIEENGLGAVDMAEAYSLIRLADAVAYED